MLNNDRAMPDIDIRALPIEKRARFAAYLRAVHHMSQAEIGAALGGLSQPHVSRLLARAEKAGVLVVERRFCAEGLGAAEQAELQGLLAPVSLARALERFCARHSLPVPGLAVYDSGPGVTPAALVKRRQRFGRMAAGRIVELLSGQHVVGITWGRTLHEAVAAIDVARPGGEEIEFVPVCADLLKTARNGNSASRLAEALMAAWRQTGPALQLIGFPAYVSRLYDAAAQAAIWRMIRDMPNYQRVFSGPQSKIAVMDGLITSVGHVDRLVHGGLEDMLHAAQLDPRMLAELVVGDLGGILVPQPDLSPQRQRLVADLNRMWTGISPGQVADIAARAEGSGRPGVIVLALRAQRAAALRELVRLRLVNQLIIDSAAAAELEHLLRSETSSAAPARTP